MRNIPWWKEPTRAQWAAFSAAWAGWVLDAFDFTIFLLVMPQIAREFGASTTAVASIVTLTLLMRLLGGFAAGAVADRWGRRLVLMVSIVWFAVCDAAVAFAPSFTWVLALRVLFGFGMGAEWTGGTTLAMESWPERSRGIASGILQGSWAVGYLLAAVVSAFVVPIWGWRALFLIAVAPALLVIPIRIWVKESPDWKRQAAERARAPSAAWGGLRELLQPSLLRTMAWVSAAMTLGFGAYYSLTSLYPTLLQTTLGLDAPGVAWNVSLFNVGMLVGAVACGAIAARRGVIAAVVVPALATLLVLPLYVGAWPALLGVGAFLGGAIGVGFAGIVPAFVTAAFPAHVRARCVGLTYHVGAFCAAFVSMGAAALWEKGGIPLPWAIALLAGACEVGLAALLVLQPKAAAAPEATAVRAVTQTPVAEDKPGTLPGGREVLA